MVSENAKCCGRPCVFGQLHLLTHKVIFLAEPPNVIIVFLLQSI